MFKGIDLIIYVELFYVLMLMGYGDDFVICDINYFVVMIVVKMIYGLFINLFGCGLVEVVCVILMFFLLDIFVDKLVCCMEVVGEFEW